jgi:predicted Rossmann-fold nucleotide-binding protein
MSQEKKEPKEEDSSLLRRYIKRVSVFGPGTVDSDKELADDYEALGSFLHSLGLKVMVGTKGGDLENILKGANSTKGGPAAYVVNSLEGVKSGAVNKPAGKAKKFSRYEIIHTNNREPRVLVMEGGLGAKNEGLTFSNAYFVLPNGGGGTYGELAHVIAESATFNPKVNKPAKPVIIWTEDPSQYKSFLESFGGNDVAEYIKHHIHYTTDTKEAKKILTAYAETNKKAYEKR